MWLQRLELLNFRSYAEQQLTFNQGVTLFFGPNGQGKTNLIEAICRVSTGQSHRNNSDQPLLRQDAAPTLIRTKLMTNLGRERQLDIELGGQRPRVRVDGQDQRRSSDAIGVLRTVLFAPEDLAIIRGDPAERRRFLDDILSQRRSTYASAKADYDRVLRQRNQLLKQFRALSTASQSQARTTIDVYTDQLVAYATPIIAARIAGIRGLYPELQAGYHVISGKTERIRVQYVPAIASTEIISAQRFDAGVDADQVPTSAEIADALWHALKKVQRDEEQRGVTLVGPHRDDVEFYLGAFPAKGYASHGETWSLTLALKLATRQILTLDDDPPVVMLDDVFAELDEKRRNHLAAECEKFSQVLVSAAVASDVPLRGEMYAVVKTEGISLASKVAAG